ncbi:MAG: hypothetical protein VR64_22805 [Desulfatitalea sp. BRH_c12]|nr:MAG: hypothetical protein VR64_22805 [Desulfatitalea sp. BRH_c12]
MWEQGQHPRHAWVWENKGGASLCDVPHTEGRAGDRRSPLQRSIVSISMMPLSIAIINGS